ncbi:alcohol dehydrogenase catalytic domain-containing protein [Halodesulfovibrio spirochaetisodalis]|uniref:alcohol dehydrogenase catalytic domain-containing protein n=1 Tax=Halodesulfovibrio spirochaetisodalis TaxID=1560234 RepID=UPI0008347363|nr:zinc-binding dehydrogenase [Halodesulfovibrio spirochaetisodalis]
MQKTALYLKDIGKNFYLTKGITDVPEPAPRHVIIKIHAAGINPVDAKLAIAGHPQWRLPFIPGLDGAGEIVQVGEDVSLVGTGDRVAWHGNVICGGAFATYIELPEHVLFKIPEELPASIAASVPCAGMTAWLSLTHRLNLKAGMSILIEAGSGGVGGFAIQIAKMRKLRVITTCSPKNYGYVAALGADHILNYKHPQLEKEILHANDNERLDAVLDTVGYSASPRNISLLKHEGQYASLLGIPHGNDADIFRVAPTIHVIALGGAYTSGNFEAQQRLANMGTEMFSAIAKGTIRPLPVTEIPFTDTAVTNAMHTQLQGHIKGKQVITIA